MPSLFQKRLGRRGGELLEQRGCLSSEHSKMEDGPFAYTSRLHIATDRWLQPAPMPRETQLFNTVVLEQFVEGLPVGMVE